MNLQTRLENKFEPLGILAYSNCCTIGCTDTYGDDDDFEIRDKGILFFKLYLDGMNYYSPVQHVYIDYEDFDYLMTNWEKECSLIKEWCKIVNVEIDKINKPTTENDSIEVIFKKKLKV